MKAERHAKVIELIRRYDIETQEDLADRLNSEGYNVTQATVSRDIRELKLTKVSNGAGKQKYVILDGKDSTMSEKFIRILKEAYISVDMNMMMQVMILLKSMIMSI